MERAEQIQEAIQLVEEARQLVDEAVQGHPKRDHYEAYGRYGFDQLLGNGNPYDSSLFDLANSVEEEKEES